MGWNFYYGGQLLGENLTYDAMDKLTTEIEQAGVNGGGWLTLNFPRGDGIGEMRILVTGGVPMAFTQPRGVA